ncbi:MAG: glycosyltransferase [Gemmatimonadota bacterium]
MTDAPAFSILIAAHNHAPYIAEALDSVLAQTCGDWEVVIVDDGSTDGTGEAAQAWCQDHQDRLSGRFHLMRIENAGQSAAYEAGAPSCRGRYIALLDSDDRWLPAKLATALRALDADAEATLLNHAQYIIDSQGRRTGGLWPRGGYLPSGDLREPMRHSGRLAVGTASSMVFRADVFRSLLPTPTRKFSSAADYYFGFGACLAGPILALGDPLGEYRIHPSSMYLQRMSNGEGLRRQLDLQETITGHFGLGPVLVHNAYYQRARFALACLTGSIIDRFRTFRDFGSAILGDPWFSPGQKIQQLGFWSLAAVLPRSAFVRLWRWFLLR